MNKCGSEEKPWYHWHHSPSQAQTQQRAAVATFLVKNIFLMPRFKN